jgi:hypothetical protein
LRSRPVHSGHVVSASSLKDWTCSKAWPHSVQAYWYVGTALLGDETDRLALDGFDCQF